VNKVAHAGRAAAKGLQPRAAARHMVMTKLREQHNLLFFFRRSRKSAQIAICDSRNTSVAILVLLGLRLPQLGKKNGKFFQLAPAATRQQFIQNKSNWLRIETA